MGMHLHLDPGNTKARCISFPYPLGSLAESRVHMRICQRPDTTLMSIASDDCRQAHPTLYRPGFVPSVEMHTGRGVLRIVGVTAIL